MKPGWLFRGLKSSKEEAAVWSKAKQDHIFNYIFSQDDDFFLDTTVIFHNGKEWVEVDMEKTDKTEILIEDLVRAICYLYGDDLTKPSLIVSHLGKGKFYVSIARYTESNGKGRFVIFKVEDKSLKNALIAAGRFVLRQQMSDLNPVERLRGSLSASEDIPF